MNRIRHHPAYRWLARILATTILVTSGPGCLAAAAAAQIGGAGAGPAVQFGAPTAYVLDFNNNTPLGGAVLGRMAAAQVALALLDSQTWDIVPDDRVHGRIQQLGIKPPFDRVNRAQIAEGVGASAVIYGWVTDARVTANPAQAYVRIQLVVEDIRTGVLVNGAIATGESQPRVGYAGDADVLLEEALSRAAFQAREQMDRFQLPHGVVLNTTVVGEEDQVALLNIGTRQGVRRGMEFIVLRFGELVGRVRATGVQADTTDARVIENFKGVKPEDRVRAIFNFRDFRPPRERARAANELPAERIRLAAGGRQIEALVASAELPAETTDQTGDQPPPGGPVVVESPTRESGRRSGARGLGKLLVGGALLLGLVSLSRKSGSSTQAFDTEARPVQTAPGGPTGIRVSWKRPRHVGSFQVLQYVVRRTGPGGLGALDVVGAVNGDVQHHFDDTETAVHDVTDVFDGVPGVPFRPPDFFNPAGSRTTFTGVPGLLSGQTYRYTVATAFRFEGDLNGDGTVETEDVMGQPSALSPLATFLEVPVITDPAGDAVVDPTDLTVSFDTVNGGNGYALVVSEDVTLDPERSIVAATKTIVPPDQGGPANDSFVGVNGFHRRFRDDQFLFLAVGVRNRNDRLAPATRGWIFSAPVRVENGSFAPPPGPGGRVAGRRRNR